ncbi:mannose-6-phosphate isomerase, class I [Raineyella sp.]|uniref:mannose-6-phosphate isomerase, class I n=1 Tax=Raineyella sp. TaxID=1911550 RepID=UPI002B1FEAAE|nr:mannose-6-phosphate isomerase, class I [Raineyella sp.]MEA5155265.1 mannose-6-phosphate isomerase, class I [Raineyella sp.]
MHVLRGSDKNYAWGTSDRIPTLLGEAPTAKPFAEYWLGAHPAGPATVDGIGLDEVIAADPSVLGECSRAEFGDRLPFLMKLLSAARALSLQVHPTAEQARAGFQLENEAGIALGDPTRTYKDDWPKPEIMVALEPFEALYGFREPRRSAEILRALGGPAAARLADRLADRAVDLVAIMRTLLADGDPALVAELTSAAPAASTSPAEMAEGPGTADDPVAMEDPEVAQARDTAALLGQEYPGDPGIVVALLMNRLRLEPLEALFVPAGVMHAYLSGTGVEVMASSDNVLRGGLTPKHIDLDGLTEVVDPRPSAPVRVTLESIGDGVGRYVTPAPHFALWRIDAAPGARLLPVTDSPRIFLTVRGGAVLTVRDDAGPTVRDDAGLTVRDSAGLTGAAGTVRLESGEAVLLAAGEAVEVVTDGLGFMTSVAP